MEIKSALHRQSPFDNYHLVFDILHCIFRAGDETKSLFSIYDNTTQRFITKQFCLHLTTNNFPTIGFPDDQKVLFQNLSYEDINHDLYIIAYIYRSGALRNPNRDRKQSKKRHFQHILRPYGAAIFKLKDHIKPLRDRLGKTIAIEPGEAAVYQRIHNEQNEKEFVELPFDIINGNTNKYYIAPMSIGIAHNYTLYNGPTDIVEKEYKFYDKLTIIQPVANIDKNMLIVTLLNARVSQKRKGSESNVQIRMSLRHNISYKKRPNCIRFGIGAMAPLQDEAESVVFYHDNNPIFQQTFTVFIPRDINELAHFHLYFGAWHVKERKNKKNEKGFGFIKLVDILSSNYEECTLSLYTNNKKITNQYLRIHENNGKLLQLEPDGANIKVALSLGNLDKFFNILICGYMTEIEKEYNLALPHALLDLIKVFLYKYII